MRPSDEEARQKIVLVLDRNFLVEAGAGSGKTKSLVDRMLALLKGGKCRIETLAAVTFTRKAAAELRGRFQTELERGVREAGDREVQGRLKDALENLEQCVIGTIHSFCARLIRARPVEIALDPDFHEMEEIEDVVYRDKCWQEYLLHVRLGDSPVLDRLDAGGLDPEDLKDSFTEVSRFPEVKLMPGREKAPDYAIYRAELEDFLADALECVPKDPPEKGFDGLMRLMRRCFYRRRNLGFDDHRVLMETLELLDKSSGFKKTYWPDKAEAEAFSKQFEAFQDRVVRPALLEWREYRHFLALDFLKPAVEFYTARRREQARVNYEDLLILASRLLRDNPEVRRYFQRQFSHILVDEFQDTDPIQAEVLLYLTGGNCEERDWRKISPRPGSLFLVGDPKQSIYRFRRADIDTYNLVKRRILESGGEVLVLTANFRSLHSLRDWINPVFRNIFPQDFSRFQAAFAPLDMVRPDEPEAGSGVFKIVLPPVRRHSRLPIAEADAAAIGDAIRWACSGGLKLARSEEEKSRGLGPEAKPADFLILLRYKKQMHVYARALEERGIPYEISGSGAFAESEEIREIVNLVKALAEPDNPIWTAAVLRGIFFGLSDNDLLAFKREGGSFSFLDRGEGKGDRVDSREAGNDTPAVRAERTRAALGRMYEWWRWTREYPASTVMERILESSGIVAYLAAGDMGSSRTGNLMKWLEILRSQELEGLTGFSDLADFSAELMHLWEIEEMSLTPGRTDSVRIMNLHKAKGLEAPVVFLAHPCGIRDHEPKRHVMRTEEDGPRGYFVFEKKRGFQRIRLSQPLDWSEKASEENRYQAAEEMRLMYVAATRARNVLVISSYGAKMAHRAWEALDDNLESDPGSGRPEVSELELPSGDAPPDREPLMLVPGEVAEARKKISEGWARASTPSYAVDTVTSLAKAELDTPVRRESAFGMSWGRVVHSVLEAIGRGRLGPLPTGPDPAASDSAGLFGPEHTAALDLLMENALAVEGRDQGEKIRLRKLIESMVTSEFWRRAMQSDKCLFEVPFCLKASGLDLGRDEEPPVILSGVIDLVFCEPIEKKKKENGDNPHFGIGWVIADYKTDQIVDDLQSYIDTYAPQVRLYSRYWAEITGQPVKEMGLYFTALNRWIAVERSGPA